mmetsp:Transcript_6325/g.15987  ORF Transcript_6325/g.15987 Transcript_6325/m.15987 type:complete len:80 (-) Transcript_6325:643-882(-)
MRCVISALFGSKPGRDGKQLYVAVGVVVVVTEDDEDEDGTTTTTKLLCNNSNAPKHPMAPTNKKCSNHRRVLADVHRSP